MQLPGRLGSTTLGDILGSLYRERATGILELLEDGGARHRVRLLCGQVTDVETSGAAPRLGEVLDKLGSLDPQGRRELERCSLGELQRPLGSVLLEKRLVTRCELLAALRYQNHARLERLYSLPDARVLFRVARIDDLQRSPLSPQEMLSGRPRARDGRRPPARELGTCRVAIDPRREALGVLGLSADASHRDIHLAFRALAAKHHPDRSAEATFTERARAIREFARLSAAYHQLVA